MSLKSYKNAFLKRNVFSLCLKRDTEELFLIYFSLDGML